MQIQVRCRVSTFLYPKLEDGSNIYFITDHVYYVVATDPAAHWVHTVDPSLAEYAPAGHRLHMEDPAAAENVPDGQGMQAAAPAAEKNPAGHCPQEDAVALEAYPATQAVHWQLPAAAA